MTYACPKCGSTDLRVAGKAVFVLNLDATLGALTARPVFTDEDTALCSDCAYTAPSNDFRVPDISAYRKRIELLERALCRISDGIGGKAAVWANEALHGKER